MFSHKVYGSVKSNSNHSIEIVLDNKEAYCSFGNYSDPCGAVKWAPQDKTFVALLSCTVDLSEWLKNKYKGSGASGIRGRPAATSSLSGAGEWKNIMCA